MIQEYEAVFLFNAQESIFKTSLEKVKALFAEKKVEITLENDMNVRKTAYEVKGHPEAHYYLFKVKLETRGMKALNDDLRLYEDVLKYLFVKLEYKKSRYPKKAEAAAV